MYVCICVCEWMKNDLVEKRQNDFKFFMFCFVKNYIPSCSCPAKQNYERSKISRNEGKNNQYI
jgi:hypothetical protein